MNKKRHSPTEKIGVLEVERIFTADFQWATRKILESDFGVDLEVEICNNGYPTGQLIGVQIKSGESYFKTDSAGDIIFRGTKTHLNYWLNHSLPIIIILHNPKTNLTVWGKISGETVSITNKGWKIEIPISQTLDISSRDELVRLNKYPLYFQRLQRLAIHKELIQEIHGGNRIVLELDEWVNKTIGRVDIKIKRINDEVNESLLSEGSYIFFRGVENLISMFPWADFEIDEYYYKHFDEDEFYSTYGIWDSEEKEYCGTTITWQEYLAQLPNIRPMEGGDGEIHHYRLVFILNELGSSFISINDFLENGIQFKFQI